MSLAKARTAAAVPFVAAMEPALLSAAFASSSRAKIFASLQVAAGVVELAAIADVSAIVPVTAVVSVVVLSFLAHATTAKAATDSAASLNLDATIVLPLPRVVKKAAPIIDAVLGA
jgi:hypothetical protein